MPSGGGAFTIIGNLSFSIMVKALREDAITAQRKKVYSKYSNKVRVRFS